MLTVRNYIEAAKRRKKEETGEEGFSLIELIIVVVILGILVAIAIPIFGSIQATARLNATKAVAASAATQWAAQIANGDTVSDYKTGDAKITVANKSGALPTDIKDVCAQASNSDIPAADEGGSGNPVESGPGC